MSRFRTVLILITIVLGVMMIPAAAAQEVAPSEGCTAISQNTTASSYTGEFLAGDVISITVSAAVESWTVSINGSDASGTLGQVEFQFTVPADGQYTITVEVTPSGSVNMNCDPAGEDDDATGPATICHIPPGNPDAAHTITVGRPAVTAHLAHGDTEGDCGDEESEFSEGDGSFTIFVLDDTGVVQVWGICVDGNCTMVAEISLQELVDAVGTIEEGEFLTFDEDTEDDWDIEVYYLGYQDREGDGEFVHVFQININVADTLWNDSVLILISDDGSIGWDTNESSD